MNYKVIYECPFLDNNCGELSIYVLEDEKGKRILSIHNKSTFPISPNELREKISQYKKLIKATKSALIYINGSHDGT